MKTKKALSVLDLPAGLLGYTAVGIAAIYQEVEASDVKSFLLEVLVSRIERSKDVEELLRLQEIEEEELEKTVLAQIDFLIQEDLSFHDLLEIYFSGNFQERVKDLIHEEIRRAETSEDLVYLVNTLSKHERSDAFHGEVLSQARRIVEMNSYSFESLVEKILQNDNVFKEIYLERLFEMVREHDLFDDLIRCHNWSSHLPEVRKAIGERLDDLLTEEVLGTLETARLSHLLSVLPIESCRVSERVYEILWLREESTVEDKLPERFLRRVALKTLRDALL